MTSETTAGTDEALRAAVAPRDGKIASAAGGPAVAARDGKIASAAGGTVATSDDKTPGATAAARDDEAPGATAAARDDEAAASANRLAAARVNPPGATPAPGGNATNGPAAATTGDGKPTSGPAAATISSGKRTNAPAAATTGGKPTNARASETADGGKSNAAAAANGGATHGDENPADARNGYLTVAVLPFAEVTVDGRVAGTTPLRNLPLRPGAHSIEISNVGLHRHTHRNQRIDAGAHHRIQLDWSN
jgi:hypothetical protein